MSNKKLEDQLDKLEQSVGKVKRIAKDLANNVEWANKRVINNPIFIARLKAENEKSKKQKGGSMKIKLEIAETVWSEVTIDNVKNVEEAKQKFYDNYDKLKNILNIKSTFVMMLMFTIGQ